MPYTIQNQPHAAPATKETLLTLHNEYLGAQDKGVDVPSKYNWKHDGIVKETRTFTFKTPAEKIHIHLEPAKENETHTDINVGPKTIPFTLFPNKSSKEAYTNFRVSPASAVEELRLLVGTHRPETCYLFKRLGTEPTFYHMADGRAIPALSRSPITAIVHTNRTGPITVSYDVVTSVSDETTLTQDGIYGEQFTGTETLCNTTQNKIKLNYNHPIVKIYLFTNVEDIEDVRILLDGKDHGLILEKRGDHYEFDFGHETSVNFSRVDNPVLLLTTKTPAKAGSTADIFAIHKQVTYRLHGEAKCGYCNC